MNFAVGTKPRALTQHLQPVKCADGYCTSRKWSGGLAKES